MFNLGLVSRSHRLAEPARSPGTARIAPAVADAGWFEYAIRRAQEIDPTFPRITPHDLRHTAASLAVSAGANVKALQHMLGHESAAVTLDTDADLFDDDLESVAVKLDAARAAAPISAEWAAAIVARRA